MYFVDGESRSSRISLFSLLHPCGIAPFETCDIRDTGCIARAHLRPACIRICFVQQSSVHGTDTEFVQISHFRSCNKSLPDTDRLRSFSSDVAPSQSLNSPTTETSSAFGAILQNTCRFFHSVLPDALPVSYNDHNALPDQTNIDPVPQTPSLPYPRLLFLLS